VREHPSLPASARMNVVNYRQSIEYDWGRYADIVRSSSRDIHDCESLRRSGNDCLKLKSRLQKALLKMGMTIESLALNADLSPALSPSSPLDQALAIMDLARSLAWSGQLTTRPDIRVRLEQIGLSNSDARLSDTYKMKALNVLAEVHLLAGQPAEALIWVVHARKLADLAKAGDSSDARKTRLFEGVALSMQGQYERALSSMAWFCSAANHPAGMSNVVDHLYSLNCAVPLAALGQSETAVALLERALSVLREGMGPHAPTVERAQHWLDRLNADRAAPPSTFLAEAFFS
jgi:hypothetical protein